MYESSACDPYLVIILANAMSVIDALENKLYL